MNMVMFFFALLYFISFLLPVTFASCLHCDNLRLHCLLECNFHNHSNIMEFSCQCDNAESGIISCTAPPYCHACARQFNDTETPDLKSIVPFPIMLMDGGSFCRPFDGCLPAEEPVVGSPAWCQLCANDCPEPGTEKYPLPIGRMQGCLSAGFCRTLCVEDESCSSWRGQHCQAPCGVGLPFQEASVTCAMCEEAGSPPDASVPALVCVSDLIYRNMFKLDLTALPVSGPVLLPLECPAGRDTGLRVAVEPEAGVLWRNDSPGQLAAGSGVVVRFLNRASEPYPLHVRQVLVMFADGDEPLYSIESQEVINGPIAENVVHTESVNFPTVVPVVRLVVRIPAKSQAFGTFERIQFQRYEDRTLFNNEGGVEDVTPSAASNSPVAQCTGRELDVAVISLGGGGAVVPVCASIGDPYGLTSGFQVRVAAEDGGNLWRANRPGALRPGQGVVVSVMAPVAGSDGSSQLMAMNMQLSALVVTGVPSGGHPVQVDMWSSTTLGQLEAQPRSMTLSQPWFGKVMAHQFVVRLPVSYAAMTDVSVYFHSFKMALTDVTTSSGTAFPGTTITGVVSLGSIVGWLLIVALLIGAVVAIIFFFHKRKQNSQQQLQQQVLPVGSIAPAAAVTLGTSAFVYDNSPTTAKYDTVDGPAPTEGIVHAHHRRRSPRKQHSNHVAQSNTLGTMELNQHAQSNTVGTMELNQGGIAHNNTLGTMELSQLGVNRVNNEQKKHAKKKKQQPWDPNAVLPASEIKRGELLGSGSFGKVFRGTWRGLQVAIKEVKSLGDEQRRALLVEAEGMKRLRAHRNVVQFYGVVETSAATEPGQIASLGLVVELCEGGSLDDTLYGVNKRLVLASECRCIALDVVRGVMHLHHEHLVHRDLAARNVLLDREGTAKLADFGMARFTLPAEEGEEGPGAAAYTVSTIGPIKWMSPEQLTRRQYSSASDMWALGCLLFELFSAQPPWAGRDNLEVARIVADGAHLAVPDNAPAPIGRLLEKCWAFESTQRPNASFAYTELSEADDWSILHSNATPQSARADVAHLVSMGAPGLPLLLTKVAKLDAKRAAALLATMQAEDAVDSAADLVGYSAEKLQLAPYSLNAREARAVASLSVELAELERKRRKAARAKAMKKKNKKKNVN